MKVLRRIHEKWWYYTFETGQHIGFFQRRTLEKLGARLALNFLVSMEYIFYSKNFNGKQLGFATGRFSAHISPWLVRRRLGGAKVMSDHQLLMRATNKTSRASHENSL